MKLAYLLPKGIRARLFLLIALVLLPLSLLLGWGYYQRFEVRRAQVLQTELEMAEKVAGAFASFSMATQRLSQSVGQAILFFPFADAATITNFLTNTAAKDPAIRHITWLSSQGLALASSNPANPGRDLSSRPEVAQILAGHPGAISDLAPQGISTNRATLLFAAGIRNDLDDLQGIVLTSIEPLALEELLMTGERRAGGVYGVFDRQGTLVFRSPEMLLDWEERRAWRDSDVLLQKALASGRPQSGAVHLAIPGGTWLSARFPIPEIGWVAGAGRPLQIALGPLHEQLRQDVTLAGLIASAAFLLAWFLSRTIAGPLRTLEADAGIMGEGRIIHQNDPAAPEEISSLRTTVEGLANGLLNRAEALRISEERYRLVNLATNDVVWDWDLGSGELLWSQALQTVFGYPPEVVAHEIGWWYEHLHPDDRERVVTGIHAVIDGGGDNWSADYRFRRQDDSYVMVLDRGHVHRDDQGRPLRMVGSMLDLSERLRQEEALRASEERFRVAQELSPDGFAIFRPVRNAPGRGLDFTWVYENAAMASMNGTEPQEVVGRSLLEVLPDHGESDFHRLYAQVAETGEPGLIEADYHGESIPGGKWFRVAAVPIGEDIAVLAQDITERKRAEEELRRLKDHLEIRVEQRTAELTAAHREMEAFAYTVSHDLRAPLRHVSSFTELLEKEIGPQLDEPGQRYVRIIAESSRRMGTLIDDLLMFSRLGRATINRTTVNLAILVEQVRTELAPETTGRSIDWQIGALPQVKGDATLLHSVMVNLLGNALKYSWGREPAQIEIGSRKEKGEWIVFVRDNGAGFDMRHADKLFGVFQRLHPASQFVGTGIGLASVKRIIERHGGRVWAHGEVDKGATISFTLPVD
jgi:PAS domain S-box-containing protein